MKKHIDVLGECLLQPHTPSHERYEIPRPPLALIGQNKIDWMWYKKYCEWEIVDRGMREEI